MQRGLSVIAEHLFICSMLYAIAMGQIISGY